MNATRYFEEFNGYRSTRYPDQEKPHHAIIRPRRPSHSKSMDLYSKIVIFDDNDAESSILECNHCIHINVQPANDSPGYCDLPNYVQDDHKLDKARGPAVVQ